MPTSPDDITLEHIDPLRHPLVCGLQCNENEVLAEGSYNFSKASKFVPYRVRAHPAPVNPGDQCEFLIRGSWVVTEFGGQWWKEEAISILTALGIRGGHRANWEARIKAKQKAHPCTIITSSYDGRLSRRQLAVRICPHEVSGPRELWQHCKETKYCCRTHQNRTYNEKRRKNNRS